MTPTSCSVTAIERELIVRRATAVQLSAAVE